MSEGRGAVVSPVLLFTALIMLQCRSGGAQQSGGDSIRRTAGRIVISAIRSSRLPTTPSTPHSSQSPEIGLCGLHNAFYPYLF